MKQPLFPEICATVHILPGIREASRNKRFLWKPVSLDYERVGFQIYKARLFTRKPVWVALRGLKITRIACKALKSLWFVKGAIR